MKGMDKIMELEGHNEYRIMLTSFEANIHEYSLTNRHSVMLSSFSTLR